MNKQFYYTTFKFYDEKGRRLSIFAEHVVDQLEITIITCSKEDNFSKKKGRVLYETWLENGKRLNGLNPKSVTFRLADKDKPKKEFLQWCRDNYFVETIIPITIQGSGPALVKGQELLVKQLIQNIIKTLKCPVNPLL